MDYWLSWSDVSVFSKELSNLMRRVLYFLCLLSLLCVISGCGRSSQPAITIGSKFFTEQIVLGELLAQHIEASTGIRVIRKSTLGGTLLCHRALLSGDLDLYVEYTGTALTTVLNDAPGADDSSKIYQRVKHG